MGGRGSGRPRSTACKCGLPYSHVDIAGQRKCRTCEAARARKRYKIVTPRGNRLLINKSIVKEYKLSLGGCCVCGIEINTDNVHMFALDHREPALKLFQLSQAKNKYSPDIVKAECAKCDLMCHNCHHLKTHKDGDHKVRRNEPTKQIEYLPLLLLMQDAE